MIIYRDNNQHILKNTYLILDSNPGRLIYSANVLSTQLYRAYMNLVLNVIFVPTDRYVPSKHLMYRPIHGHLHFVD